MSGRSSSSARSAVIGEQISPDVWRTKKAMASGVANSAAMMRSPSFSLSSSSTTMTISPRPMAAIAFSTGANGIRRSLLSRLVRCGPSMALHSRSRRAPASPPALPAAPQPRWSSSQPALLAGAEQLLDVLGDHVDLKVDTIALSLAPERGHLSRMRDDGDGEAVIQRFDDGEAAAVDGDRPLLHDVAEQVLGHAHPQVGGGLHDLADGVDVTLHDVAAQPVGGPHGPLEVDSVTGAQIAEVGSGQRLVHGVDGVPTLPHLHDGEAAAVVTDGVTDLGVLEYKLGLEHEATAVA